uniref:Uncharacterized protein n=1 Tax=Trichobilharzia regenti TaxID=157069 RepID=A0AA85JEX1_TRIRE|nr:unnamed protein product [Trichobilharzia regenti]
MYPSSIHDLVYRLLKDNLNLRCLFQLLEITRNKCQIFCLTRSIFTLWILFGRSFEFPGVQSRNLVPYINWCSYKYI